MGAAPATLRIGRSPMGRRRTGHPVDARAADGLLEIDARCETIARKVLARLNSRRSCGDRGRTSAEVDRIYRVNRMVENGIVNILLSLSVPRFVLLDSIFFA